MLQIIGLLLLIASMSWLPYRSIIGDHFFIYSHENISTF